MPASALMNVMTAAVRKAGRSLARDFGEVAELQVSVKGPANFVTAADIRAEEILFTELAKARPGYGFLMEERGAVEGRDKTHRWIVDPLDGTTNFLHSIPIFCISVGLEREGQIVAGVIYNPAMNELYTAENGKGAFLNDRRIRVAARRQIGESIVASSIPHRGRPGYERFMAEQTAVRREAVGLRTFGSAALALAWVAAGRIDAYWERNLKAWDMAAGIVIVEEAGGHCHDLAGGTAMMTEEAILAGNRQIAGAVAELIKGGASAPPAPPAPVTA